MCPALTAVAAGGEPMREGCFPPLPEPLPGLRCFTGNWRRATGGNSIGNARKHGE